MIFEELLPYLEIASFLIVILVMVYEFGKWRQRSETDKEDLKRRLDALSAKIDKVPQEFLPVFIDLYKMWDKLKENPEATKKRKTQND
jgi:hypothetical protein